MDAKGFEITLTVHDEIVVECASETAETTKHQMEEIMCTAPPWAEGLPLAVEGSVMSRYGK
jgi:DNA polymerase